MYDLTSQRVLAGAAGAGEKVYVEDVFSTWLYTGNGSTQTIQNGIALGDNVVNYLTGKTITNIGSAITLGSLSNVNDGILETTNGTNYAYTAGTLDIYVDMGAGFAATGYLIAPQGTTNSSVFNTIDGFIVKASNDASTWTTIQTFSGYDSTYPAWNAGSFRPFTFSNTTAYRYWRLQSTDASNDSISEWALLSNSAGIGKGGLVWIKYRDGIFGNGHYLYDTARGVGRALQSNLSDAQTATDNRLTSFNSNGFSLAVTGGSALNASTYNYASWTFRKAAKFFDVTTATQTTGNTGWLTFNHNLGSVPGAILIKVTNATDNWFVYHRSTSSQTLFLNLTNAAAATVVCQNVTSTSFEFNLANYGSGSGSTYVAYLFAHDAGGFGDSGNDSVVKCGSYTTDASAIGSATLGWEPQWILLKATTGATSWIVVDNMRGLSQSNTAMLYPNTSGAEINQTAGLIRPTSTGFIDDGALVANGTVAYIAIRRGPMKTPTDATKVFSTITSSASSGKITAGFAVDTLIAALRSGYVNGVCDRLRGVGTTSTEVYRSLITYSTAAENTSSGMGSSGWDNTGFNVPGYIAGGDNLYWSFGRAPGFFDVVTYTGTGSANSVSHNLGVTPELIIVHGRSNGGDWATWATPLGLDGQLLLNKTNAAQTLTNYWSGLPSSTSFSVSSIGYSDNNGNGNTYVAYLFATCLGVSKVGSYTGTGTTQQINCGFTAGARFVLIKRTDSTGDWYAWDSARGIVAGNDPYVLLNSSVPEVANTDYVDTFSSGFEISSTAPAAINANGGSFIFLAIA